MTKTRIALVAVTACAGVAAYGAPAQAHVDVKKTKESKKSVSVTFTGPLQEGTLKVKGPDGKASKGSGGRDPRKISRLAVDLKGGLKSGSYSAKWKITAADGHEQSGSFSFNL